MLATQIAERFGEISPEMRTRIEGAELPALREAARKLVRAESVDDLGL
jgi:hypothetical protein